MNSRTKLFSKISMTCFLSNIAKIYFLIINKVVYKPRLIVRTRKSDFEILIPELLWGITVLVFIEGDSTEGISYQTNGILYAIHII